MHLVLSLHGYQRGRKLHQDRTAGLLKSSLMLASRASRLSTCTVTIIASSPNAGKEKKDMTKKAIKCDGVRECKDSDLLKNDKR